jgi:hypothetical protein
LLAIPSAAQSQTPIRDSIEPAVARTLAQGSPPGFDTTQPINVWAPGEGDSLSFPRALVWAVVPKAADYYSTADCFYLKPFLCKELNQLQPTVEHRTWLGLTSAVLAAELFYYVESDKGLRLWPTKKRIRSKIPRYAWVVANLGLAVKNSIEARK